MIRPLFCSCLMAVALAAVARQADDDIKELAGANNFFAREMYNVLSAEAPGENMFFSPFSISTCMGIVYLMAKGETANEIARVLHFNPSQSKLADSFKHALSSLDKNTFSWANSIFVEKTFELRKDYLDSAEDGFGVTPENVDFIKNPEGARNRINEWVSTNTKGKINDLLPQGSVDQSTAMVAASAIHFKASWKTKFVKLDAQQNFNLADGTKKKVDMMSVESSDIGFKFFEEMSAMGVSIPYSTAQKMVLLVPQKFDGLPAVEAALSKMNFVEDVVNKISSGPDVHLVMPKFNMTIGQSLLGPFKKMGMSRIFKAGLADFSGATDSNTAKLALSGIEHKAFVEVNEEGTEAAAATGAVIVAVSAPLTFYANKPFLFAILDSSSNTVAFLGRYAKP